MSSVRTKLETNTEEGADWIKRRVRQSEHEYVNVAAAAKYCNRLCACLWREWAKIKHPLVAFNKEVVVNEDMPFGFLFNLSALKSVKTLEIPIRVFCFVRTDSRTNMSCPLSRRRAILS